MWFWPVLAAVVLMTVATLAAEKKMGAPEITIPGGTKGDIAFPHAVHQTVLGDCNICHALFPQEPGTIAGLKAAGTLRKMQVMKVCQGCHKEMTQAGKKTGPVNCNDCHQQ
jgi:uncharacterized membrane protein